MDIMELIVPTELVICKSCGYVMGKRMLGDKCPACGVPAKMFEPHTEKISRYRRLVLWLDIHPILVHFPQAFTFTSLVLCMLCLTVSGAAWEIMLGALKTLSICLPFTVMLAVAAGLFDGKVRFRRVTTPHLMKKICIAILFLIFSGANASLAMVQHLTRKMLLEMLALLFVCFICTFLLGLIGARLMNSKFPG